MVQFGGRLNANKNGFVGRGGETINTVTEDEERVMSA